MDEKKVKEQIKVLEQAAKKAKSSKTKALNTLVKAGIVTNTGKLTKRYGG